MENDVSCVIFHRDHGGILRNVLVHRADAQQNSQRSLTMICKRLILASALLAAAAGVSVANAGATISDSRYWPDRARVSDQYPINPPVYVYGGASGFAGGGYIVREARRVQISGPAQAARAEASATGHPSFHAQPLTGGASAGYNDRLEVRY